MWTNPSPDRERTLFTFVAKEGDGMIVSIGSSDNVKRRCAAIERAVERQPHNYEQDPLADFLRYCKKQNLTWEFRELATIVGDNYDAKFHRNRWHEAALTAGLFPRFFYNEDVANDIVTAIASGQQRNIPVWPEDLRPQEPFMNPFYAFFALGQSPKAAPVAEASKEDIRNACFYYIDRLWGVDRIFTFLPNWQVPERQFFEPNFHLGPKVMDIEHEGKVTDVGDRWIEIDRNNRRTALLLLATTFDLDVDVDAVPDKDLPPYLTGHAAQTLYQNRGESLPVEKWKNEISAMAGSDIYVMPSRPESVGDIVNRLTKRTAALEPRRR